MRRKQKANTGENRKNEKNTVQKDIKCNLKENKNEKGKTKSGEHRLNGREKI